MTASPHDCADQQMPTGFPFAVRGSPLGVSQALGQGPSTRAAADRCVLCQGACAGATARGAGTAPACTVVLWLAPVKGPQQSAVLFRFPGMPPSPCGTTPVLWRPRLGLSVCLLPTPPPWLSLAVPEAFPSPLDDFLDFSLALCCVYFAASWGPGLEPHSLLFPLLILPFGPPSRLSQSNTRKKHFESTSHH